MNHRERMRQRQKNSGREQSAVGNSHTRQSIELRIDELVLSGLSFTARGQVADSVQRELANMLSEHGLPQQEIAPTARERIDGGTIPLRRGASAERIGSEIARAVYDGLSAGKSAVGGQANKT